MRVLIVLPVVLFGFYLLFAGTMSRSEIGTGLVLAALVTGLAAFVRRGPRRALRVRPTARVLGRPIMALFADAVRVGRVLTRAILVRPFGQVGQVARQPFRIGDHAPREAGRRAAVVLAASLAPNGYALHLDDRDGGALVLHRLAPVQPRPDREWPA